MEDKKYIQIDPYTPQTDLNNQETANPSLVVFPYNYPKLDLLNDENESKWLICENKSKKFKDDKLLLGETKTILYNAKSKLDRNLSTYVIGIYSKKKRKMKFVDVDSIFSVNQKVRR